VTSIVYGVGCTWWDTIDNASSKRSGLPCCPHCGSVLMQTDDKSWWKGVLAFDDENPGYVKIVQWTQGKCFRDMETAMSEYDREQTLKRHYE
jgi:hypothetical protein